MYCEANEKALLGILYMIIHVSVDSSVSRTYQNLLSTQLGFKTLYTFPLLLCESDSEMPFQSENPLSLRRTGLDDRGFHTEVFFYQPIY